MRRWLAAALLAVACGVAACAIDPDVEKKSGMRTEPQPVFTVAGKGTREQTFPLEQVLARVPDASKSQIVSAMHAIDASASVQERNSAVGDLVFASESNCQVYLSALRGGQVTARVTVDTLTNLTAGAAAISRPPASAQLLAAFASFFNATGASIDRNIFAQEGAEVITAQIETLRAQKLREIRRNLTGGYAAYPIAFALRDVMEYHGYCSVRKALGSLPATVAARETAIKAIRIAAAKGLENGESGKTIAAIVAGLSDSAGGAEDSSATAATPPPPDLTGDFTAFQASATTCVAAVKGVAQTPLAPIEKSALKSEITDADNAMGAPLKTKSTAACAKTANAWRDRFFDTIESQSKSAQAQVDAVYDTLTKAVAGAKGDAKAISKADATAKSALDDVFASLQDTIVTTIKVEQERSGHDRRETLRVANKAGQADGAKADDVAKTLNLATASHRANGDATSTLDPMIQMVSDAIASAKNSNPASGVLAAAAASGAANAYDASWRAAGAG